MREMIEKCVECELCIDVCPIYNITKRDSFHPLSRLRTVGKLLEGEQPTDEMIESMYNCTQCGRCDEVCPSDIKISEIVGVGRRELVRKGLAPLEAQKKIIKGILDVGNSVGGDPEKRIDWLPQPLEERRSETLLFVGCLPSYLVKGVALSSYLLLKEADLDFTILRDEGCCGVYLFDAGVVDAAERVFQDNVDRFAALGIKRIITPCAGCYRCFKRYYPEVLGSVPFETYHVVEILHDLVSRGKLELRGAADLEVTYHDPCRLGRKEGLYEEPRELLRVSGVEIKELEQHKENGLCCGAGAGVRSIYRNLSMEVATCTLTKADSDILVTSCPFCAFNLAYAARKKKLNREVKYVTELLIEEEKQPT